MTSTSSRTSCSLMAQTGQSLKAVALLERPSLKRTSPRDRVPAASWRTIRPRLETDRAVCASSCGADGPTSESRDRPPAAAGVTLGMSLSPAS